jgi:hypothetical protein
MKSFFRKNDFLENIFRRLARTKKSQTAKNEIRQLLLESGLNSQIQARTVGIRQVWPDWLERSGSNHFGPIPATVA